MDADQREVAVTAVLRFWQPRPVAVRDAVAVGLTASPQPGHPLVAVHTDLGSFTVDVATAEVVTGALRVDSVNDEGDVGPAGARREAESFARTRFPWTAGLGVPAVQLENHGAGIAFYRVSWREMRGRVEMPTAAHVQVAMTGRVFGFAGRRVAVTDMPAPTVTCSQANEIAEDAIPGATAERATLCAVFTDGQWRPAWVVEAEAAPPPTGTASYRMRVLGARFVVVDAVNGAVVRSRKS